MRRGVLVILVALLSLVAARGGGPVAAVGDPVAAVWYRGVPAGVPRLDDLAEIKALGFSGVTWPLMSADGGPELRRLADIVGLTVVIRDTPPPRPAGAAPKPGPYLDIDMTTLAVNQIGPTIWRAVAHGARVISFDAGTPQGTGLSGRDGRSPAWVAPAAAIARQLDFNGQLVGALRPGPDLAFEAPAPPALDVVMLDGNRSWVLVATNLSRNRVHGVARLPPGVPYALWLDLLDASTMSMLNEPAGPKWTFDLDPWGTRVYVIDKILKTPVFNYFATNSS